MQLAPSKRLRYDRFQSNDANALARLLADPEITRNITANGSTPERCLASALRRIAWHNRYWKSRGYGVWALRARNQNFAPQDELIGWCGFVPPEGEENNPEILYGLARDFRKMGLASEAAKHTIAWLFENTKSSGVAAVIFSRLNPGSVNLIQKLGMVYRQKMDFSEFISDSTLALEVIEYEIWRLKEGPESDLETLIQQTAFRAGQFVEASGSTRSQIKTALTEALTKRCSNLVSGKDQYLSAMLQQFQQGVNETYMDCYYISRKHWLDSQISER